MKLIIESWKRYLSESTEASYFPWFAEFKALSDKYLDQIPDKRYMGSSSLHFAENFWQALEDLLPDTDDDSQFQRLGEGSYRAVYSPPGDNSVVIKTITSNDPTSAQMNKEDIDMSRKYPNIFAKTYAHEKNYIWVILEKLTVVTKGPLLDEMLKVNFPDLIKIVEKAKKIRHDDGKRRFTVFDSPSAYLRIIMSSLRLGRMHGWDPNEQIKKDMEAPHNMETLMRFLFLYGVNNNPIYYEIYKAVSADKVDPSELRTGNIAMNDRSEFRIIDSSIFAD